jgi:hypothetical protein
MATDDRELVELRGHMPASIVAVIDAVAIAKRKSRMDIVNRVMLIWAREQLHVATVVGNTTRGNPPLPETDWGRLE